MIKLLENIMLSDIAKEAMNRVKKLLIKNSLNEDCYDPIQ